MEDGVQRSWLWFAIALGCNGPGKDSDTGLDPEAPTFTRVRTEILTPSCALSTCHGPGTVNGMVLEAGGEYDALVNAPSMATPTETLVVPGNANGSYAVAKLEGGVGIAGASMPPPFGGLNPDLIQLFRDWIDLGAEDN